MQAEQVMPGESEDALNGVDEAEQEERFARCKPLAPVDSGRWHAGRPSRAGCIFYGNDNFFIFFRLHQHLLDRWGLGSRVGSLAPPRQVGLALCSPRSPSGAPSASILSEGRAAVVP